MSKYRFTIARHYARIEHVEVDAANLAAATKKVEGLLDTLPFDGEYQEVDDSDDVWGFNQDDPGDCTY